MARLEGFCGACVQCPAAFVEQAVVGDAPGEPMPEGIGDVREQTRLIQKLASPSPASTPCSSSDGQSRTGPPVG